MCGIFAYTGTRTAAPLLVDGLRTLEYRGYDSAGVYIPKAGVIKAVGPIDNLAAKLDPNTPGTAGIAHTRWATHGPPTEANAHPHHGEAGRVFVVHNGIIENYRELKQECLAAGHTFLSDTDTEVLAHLIETEYRDRQNLKEALRHALLRVRGAYGVAVMAADDPATIAVARMGSPIVIGISSFGHFVASDVAALLAHTKDVIYIDDGEIALLTSDAHTIESFEAEERQRAPETIAWSIEAVQKNSFEHFMLKEIMEGPEVLENSARGRLIVQEGRAKLGGLEPIMDRLETLPRLTITGCGSAYYAGLVGKHMLEIYAKLPTDVLLASEYRYMTHLADPESALLAISQSGETADTLASIREAKARSLLTLGVVNVVGSTIARETDAGVYNHAGPEVGVASTKAFISQLEVLMLLALCIGRERGMSREEGQEIAAAIASLPEVVRGLLKQATHISHIAMRYASCRDALYIGRGATLPIAYEGALKLKEVSYVHAEGYGAGERKNGPIAMIDRAFPTIAIALSNNVYEKMISNIEEIKARGGPVIAIATEGDTMLPELADDVICVPAVHPILEPILAVVPLHLFAYFMGVAKGYNVDRPRNLAKAVTVE